MKTYLAGLTNKPETQDMVEANTMMDAAEAFAASHNVPQGESITIEADTQSANYVVAQ